MAESDGMDWTKKARHNCLALLGNKFLGLNYGCLVFRIRILVRCWLKAIVPVFSFHRIWIRWFSLILGT